MRRASTLFAFFSCLSYFTSGAVVQDNAVEATYAPVEDTIWLPTVAHGAQCIGDIVSRVFSTGHKHEHGEEGEESALAELIAMLSIMIALGLMVGIIYALMKTVCKDKEEKK